MSGNNSNNLRPPPPSSVPSSSDIATPSNLTPNARSEAEAVFFANSLAQTDSAAPSTTIETTDRRRGGLGYTGLNPGVQKEESEGEIARSGSIGLSTREDSLNDSKAMDAHISGPRPGSLARTSSSNYIEAVAASNARKSSIGFDTRSPPPDLSGGVVPKTPTSPVGVGAESLKRSRARGLSLGSLGSWNDQDMKHQVQAGLMASVAGGEQGYSSAQGEKK